MYTYSYALGPLCSEPHCHTIAYIQAHKHTLGSYISWYYCKAHFPAKAYNQCPAHLTVGLPAHSPQEDTQEDTHHVC